MTREELARLAAGIPPLIRFGTSSWTYPGWKGLVYHRDYGGKGTAAPMLAEYSEFPLFRTVGIDSSFYGPPTDATLCPFIHLETGWDCAENSSGNSKLIPRRRSYTARSKGTKGDRDGRIGGRR